MQSIKQKELELKERSAGLDAIELHYKTRIKPQLQQQQDKISRLKQMVNIKRE